MFNFAKLFGWGGSKGSNPFEPKQKKKATAKGHGRGCFRKPQGASQAFRRYLKHNNLD